MNDLIGGYSVALIVTVAGLAALALTQLIARMASLSDFLIDRPNGRSSHEVATPRSGGLAIIGGWMAGMAVVAAFAEWDGFAANAFAFAPLVVAAFLFGLADDRINLSAPLKFLAQIALAALFVAVFGALESAPMPFVGETALGTFAAPLTILWIVGFMNAFNFMDGINGIAASCGALALAGLAAASAFLGAPFFAASAGLGAIALLSFLPVNFPRARLFMGDNGSQAIGFLIAASAVGAANASGGRASALFMPVLMLPFIFDVAFTLFHRAFRRRDVLSAHREHLYQLLVRLGSSQVAVTAVFLSLTAVSAAFAFVLLRAPQGAQFAAPILLAALLAVPAIAVLRRARRAGLLAAPAAAGARQAAPAPASRAPSDAEPDIRPQAAE